MTPPYDHAPPVSPPSGEPASAAAPKNWRSGSQNRQCTKSLQIMLTPEQYAIVESWANDAALSASAYGKAVLFGTPGPRARRKPHIHAVALGEATTALNRIGNNFNQTAHVLNASGAIGMAQKYLDALEEVRLTLRAMREAVGHKEPGNDNQGKPAQ